MRTLLIFLSLFLSFCKKKHDSNTPLSSITNDSIDHKNDLNKKEDTQLQDYLKNTETLIVINSPEENKTGLELTGNRTKNLAKIFEKEGENAKRIERSNPMLNINTNVQKLIKKFETKGLEPNPHIKKAEQPINVQRFENLPQGYSVAISKEKNIQGIEEEVAILHGPNGPVGMLSGNHVMITDRFDLNQHSTLFESFFKKGEVSLVFSGENKSGINQFKRDVKIYEKMCDINESSITENDKSVYAFKISQKKSQSQNDSMLVNNQKDQVPHDVQKGMLHSNEIAKPLNGVQSSELLLKELFPEFTPKENLKGGITEDVFFGTYRGEEVVAKKVKLEEYHIMWRLKDSGVIVPVKAFNSKYSDAGVVMEKARGDATKAMNRADFDFDRYALETSSAINEMHKVGIIHGDVKGANFLELENGKYVVSDFGGSQYFGHPISTSGSDPKFREPWRITYAPVPAHPVVDIYAQGVSLGHTYLTKLKKVDIQEPDFTLLEKWKERGYPQNDPDVAKYYEQVSSFQTQIHTQLQLFSVTDPKAKLFFDMIQNPSYTKTPTMEEVVSALSQMSKTH